MCGGTATVPPTRKLMEGLSPRVRGNLVYGPESRFSEGSIPACAGEPGSCPFSVDPLGVYPRVCGGTLLRRITGSSDMGLSPRVRGNRYLILGLGWMGLSPRVRGNRNSNLSASDDSGSIPACAGEPGYGETSSGQHRVYPRVCGGTSISRVAPGLPKGLSPRVRGNLCRRPVPVCRPGSIPACAGEPASSMFTLVKVRVYPRVCGGTPFMRSRSSPRPGLSPRVRGNHRITAALPARAGSIPACAGEPPLGTLPSGESGVYPRVCGGTTFGLQGNFVGGGLSPRVRGNLLQIKY